MTLFAFARAVNPARDGYGMARKKTVRFRRLARDLQRLKETGAITEQQFDRLMTRIVAQHVEAELSARLEASWQRAFQRMFTSETVPESPARRRTKGMPIS